MLPTVHIRQDALRKWCGDSPKIDVTDAVLVALIRSMNATNPHVKELIWQGYFLLSRKYVREMLPLINLTDDWISRKLKHLQEVGLVDLRLRDTGKGKLRYAKLSRLYWQEEERANRQANSHKDYSPMGVQPHGSTDPNPTGCSPTDQINDHEERQASAAAPGEPGGVPPAGSTPEGMAAEPAGAAFGDGLPLGQEVQPKPGGELLDTASLPWMCSRTEQARAGLLQPARAPQRRKISNPPRELWEINPAEAEAELARIREDWEADDDPFDEREAVAAGPATLPENSNRGPA
jgi:hypothetical protein